MEKSWYFLVEFLTSLTSFFVSSLISAMNFWLENLPNIDEADEPDDDVWDDDYDDYDDEESTR